MTMATKIRRPRGLREAAPARCSPLGVSRYAPDPMAALEEAKEAEGRRSRSPSIAKLPIIAQAAASLPPDKRGLFLCNRHVRSMCSANRDVR